MPSLEVPSYGQGALTGNDSHILSASSITYATGWATSAAKAAKSKSASCMLVEPTIAHNLTLQQGTPINESCWTTNLHAKFSRTSPSLSTFNQLLILLLSSALLCPATQTKSGTFVIFQILFGLVSVGLPISFLFTDSGGQVCHHI